MLGGPRDCSEPDAVPVNVGPALFTLPTQDTKVCRITVECLVGKETIKELLVHAFQIIVSASLILNQNK